MPNQVELNPVGLESQEAVGSHYVLSGQIYPTGLASAETVPTPSLRPTVVPESILTQEAIGNVIVRVDGGSGQFETVATPAQDNAIASVDKGNDTIKVLEIKPTGESTFRTILVNQLEAGDAAITVQRKFAGQQTLFEGKPLTGLPIADLYSSDTTTQWILKSPGTLISDNNGVSGMFSDPTGQTILHMGSAPTVSQHEAFITFYDSGQAGNVKVTYMSPNILIFEDAMNVDGMAFELVECAADPGVPSSSDRARLFCIDDGAGKTQLAVRFGSGATQIIATEP